MTRRQLIPIAILVIAALAIATVVIVKVTRSNDQGSGQPPASREAGLQNAIAHSTVIGPTDPNKVLELTFTLETRSGQQLNSIINSGRTLSAEAFASQFAPDPALVQRVISLLHEQNVDARWESGSSVLVVAAPVSVVNRVLGVTITDYHGEDGRDFYAPDHPVAVPTALRIVISSVAGLDNWGQLRSKHIATAIKPGGLTADEVLPFYNISPMRARGLDGSGQTIVFPEIDDLPDSSDIDAYARAHGLPAFDVSVQRNTDWGQPQDAGTPGAEITLDLEVAHALAPKAKLVVYIGSGDLQKNAVMEDAMVRANPGAIISDSIGLCEAAVSDSIRAQMTAINARAAATGMSHFVASGDLGAYDCQRNPDVLSTDFPSALPSVTTIGGTSVFLGSQPGYFREVAWGDSISGSGSGGGLSINEPRPDWQKGPGVDNSDSGSTPMRQVPDVAGVSDTNTGWAIRLKGADQTIGGTSAAAPLWSAMIALIDQDMAGSGLKPVGFANPALYWMGQQTNLSPPPFHDVTIGNNFRYHATQGWDFVTGWGTPDVDALDKAWQAFERQNGG